MRRALAASIIIIGAVGCGAPETKPEPCPMCQAKPSEPAARADKPEASDLPAWLQRGHDLLAQEKVDEAASCYEHVLTLDGEQPIALMNLGLIELDRENYRLAVDLLARAVDGRRLRPELQAKAEQYLRQAREKAS